MTASSYDKSGHRKAVGEAEQLHEAWKASQASRLEHDVAPEAPASPASDHSASSSVSDDVDAPAFPLLELPTDVLHSIVSFVAASERSGSADGSHRLQHGWRGSLRDGSMPITSSLALSCRKLGPIALRELWEELHITLDGVDDSANKECLLSCSLNIALVLRDSPQLARTKRFYVAAPCSIVSRGPNVTKAMDKRSLDVLQGLLAKATRISTLDFELAPHQWTAQALECLRSCSLCLFDLRIISVVRCRAEGSDPVMNEIWRSLKLFLLQQGKKMTALTLHIGDNVINSGASSVPFDLAAILAGMPKLQSLDYMPFSTNSWSTATTRPMPPLRVLEVRQSRLGWLAKGLLPAIADTLEVLSLRFDPPANPFLAKETPGFRQSHYYHFLQASNAVEMPSLPHLRRLSIDFRHDQDGKAELYWLLSSFAPCQAIQQLWLSCRVRTYASTSQRRGTADEYFHDALLPALDEEGAFMGLEELYFGTNANESLEDEGNTVWPGRSDQFEQDCLAALGHRDLLLRVRGLENDLDIKCQRVWSDFPDNAFGASMQLGGHLAVTDAACQTDEHSDDERKGTDSDEDSDDGSDDERNAKVDKEELIDMAHEAFEVALRQAALLANDTAALELKRAAADRVLHAESMPDHASEEEEIEEEHDEYPEMDSDGRCHSDSDS